jgi:hypothetical protein
VVTFFFKGGKLELPQGFRTVWKTRRRILKEPRLAELAQVLSKPLQSIEGGMDDWKRRPRPTINKHWMQVQEQRDLSFCRVSVFERVYVKA